MDNLLSIVLELRALNQPPAPIKAWYGKAAQAVFLNAVKHAHSSALSARMHAENHVRAYTASSLFSDSPLTQHFSADARYYLRYTALDDETAAALRQAVRPNAPLSPGALVNLVGAKMQITAVHALPSQHPLAGSESAVRVWNETMQAAGKLPPSLTIFLHTPTFFKSTQTDSLTPMPSPLLVFSSLSDRWKVYMDLQIPPQFRQFVQDYVSLVEDDLHLVTLSDGERERCGSVGRLSFVCAKPDSPYWLFARILVRFAFYSGIGKETARGFGQAEYIDHYKQSNSRLI
jgi:CRISPR-associated endoribonuclease Cas6